MTAPLRIDAARLWSDLMAMARIGATAGGGSHRPALSPEDGEARAQLRAWAEEAGLVVTVDAIGNMIARAEGTDPALPPAMIGSHLDTQTPGGRFDGVLGVLAGLAVARAIRGAGIRHPRALEVANWTNEEGARFQPGVMGSAVFTGALGLKECLAARDPAGVSVAEALRDIGVDGGAPVGGRPVHRYLELHIEQGPELERRGIDVAAVTGSSWICSGYADLHGANGHAQTMPMPLRRNALAAAARLILAIEEIGAAVAPEGMVSATVVDNLPNNRVNIPHLTRLSWTAVHAAEEGRARIEAQIEAAADAIAAQTGIGIEIAHRHRRAAVSFPEDLRAAALSHAAGLGLSSCELDTLTAHDALPMSAICPTALIFVPCRDGISHAEAEHIDPIHAENGANLLLQLTLDALI